MPNPQQPAQPQPAQSTPPQQVGTGPVQGIDWQAAWQQLKPFARLALQLLIQQLSGQQPAMEAAAPVRCGPDGSQVCTECLDAATRAQIEALALMVQARQCPDCPT
jgi:hypothetical protein